MSKASLAIRDWLRLLFIGTKELSPVNSEYQNIGSVEMKLLRSPGLKRRTPLRWFLLSW